MFGFLLEWPTLVTLAMVPILVFMYVRLASREERDSEPRFIPRLGRADAERHHVQGIP